ncbi:MAG: hypothetical protein C5B50_21020 [Verrucomicrobia bacterium]|nr:MAG: hypothetical protein C5B50_21020 [Verrucomicrobiota bacterium]
MPLHDMSTADPREIYQHMIVPLEGIPAESVKSDKRGCFDLAPAMHTEIAFMFMHNPKRIHGSFLISADGYGTNRVEGVATSHNHWRVPVGSISLQRQ